MIRNARVGERVKAVGLRFVSSEGKEKGKITSRWPAGAEFGTIVKISYGTRRFIFVKPDHPRGIGETMFLPGELERVKPA